MRTSSSTGRPGRTQPEAASESLPPIECLQRAWEVGADSARPASFGGEKRRRCPQLWGCTTVTSPFRATSVIISGSDKINQLPNCGPRVRRHLHHPIRRPNFHSQRQNSTMAPAHHSQTRWGVDPCPNVHCTCLTILPKTTASPSLTLPTQTAVSVWHRRSAAVSQGSRSAKLPGST